MRTLESESKVIVLATSIAICIGVVLFLRTRTQEAPALGTCERHLREQATAREAPALEAPAAAETVTNSDASTEDSAVLIDEVVAVKNRPIEVLTDGFASASSCTRCHQEQHRSWHASFHRTMTQTVTPKSAFEAIEDDKVNIGDADYELFARAIAISSSSTTRSNRAPIRSRRSWS